MRYKKPKKIILFFVIGLSFYSFSFAEKNEEALQKVNGFSLVQYEDNGEKKWELKGKSAEVDEKKIKITEISALAFGKKTSFKIKARKGDFYRKESLAHLENNVIIKATDGTLLTTDFLDWNTITRNASTAAPVNIKKTDFEVNGKGAIFNLDEKITLLKKDVKAKIKSSDIGFSKIRSPHQEPGKKENTIITCSGPLEINYKKNKATFKDNVKIEDTEGNVLADRMDVYFGKDTRRVRCVVARGNVKIINGASVTHTEKAIYLVDRGRVILPKRPKLIVQNEKSK